MARSSRKRPSKTENPLPVLDPFLIAKDAKRLTVAVQNLVAELRVRLHYKWRVTATEYGLIIHVARGEIETLKEKAGGTMDIGLIGTLKDESDETLKAEAINFSPSVENGENYDVFYESEIKEECGDTDYFPVPVVAEGDIDKDANLSIIENCDDDQIFIADDDDDVLSEKDKDVEYAASLAASTEDITESRALDEEASVDEQASLDKDRTPDANASLDEGASLDGDVPLVLDKNVSRGDTPAPGTSCEITLKKEILPIADVTTPDADDDATSTATASASSARASSVTPPDSLKGAYYVALTRLRPQLVSSLDACPTSSIQLCSKDLLFECSWCPREFSRRSSFLFHKRREHNPISTEERNLLKRLNKQGATGTSSDEVPHVGGIDMASIDTVFQCRLCADSFPNEFDLRRHFNGHQVCWICGLQCNSTFGVIRHESKVHGLVKVPPEKPEDIAEDPNSTLRRCQFCSLPCKIPNGKVPYKLLRHLESHRIPGDQIRDAEIESTLDLFPRAPKKESKSNNPPCISCGETFPTMEELHAHKKIHRTCPECLLELPHVTALKAHMKSVHGSSALTQHLLKTRKTFLCSVCGRIFLAESKLKEHHRLSHPKQSVETECDKCGKKCKDLAAFQRHAVTHSSARNRICPTCGKAFKTATNLHQHKQQHLPRKHICGCGHAFTYPHGLKNHQARCFAGLPCKKPHTKNRPQKDEFGQIIPPKTVSAQSFPTQMVSPPVEPIPRASTEPVLAPQSHSSRAAPAYLPPPPSTVPKIFPPQIFPADPHPHP